MKIRAAKNKIVILPLEAAEFTPGGIILTKDAQEVSNRGVVISSGSDQCSPGDTVVFTRYVGCEWEHDRKKYYIITEEHLLAIEEDEEIEAARAKKNEASISVSTVVLETKPKKRKVTKVEAVKGNLVVTSEDDAA